VVCAVKKYCSTSSAVLVLEKYSATGTEVLQYSTIEPGIILLLVLVQQYSSMVQLFHQFKVRQSGTSTGTVTVTDIVCRKPPSACTALVLLQLYQVW